MSAAPKPNEWISPEDYIEMPLARIYERTTAAGAPRPTS
jgi:hypothetical protein